MKNIRCGANLIKSINNNTLCKTCDVGDVCVVTYSNMEYVKKSHPKHRHLIMSISNKWKDFLHTCYLIGTINDIVIYDNIR